MFFPIKSVIVPDIFSPFAKRLKLFVAFDTEKSVLVKRFLCVVSIIYSVY